ncbi:glycoside hydrolase family 13 protein [uncultured Clostridium sp.]|uniref:glycoside hydrolase family 13 protein n=1 Tax=uncultured Clostridium sp. TaxID=59620 RepID=UPI00280B4B53|nr:glycoside hydrolase family 13 protein [uncultured Clostridium sp.]
MNFAAVIHEPKSSYSYAYSKDKLHIRIKTSKNDVEAIELLAVDPFNWIPRNDGTGIYDFDKESVYRIKMIKEQITRDHDVWFAEINDINWKRIKYCFILENNNEKYILGSHHRLPYTKDESKLYDLFNYFNYPYINEEDVYKAPEWVADTIWYEIFPKSFYGSNGKNNGDLAGIIEKLDYIKDMGFNGLYLTPIFESPSDHKYDTTDYFKVDKEFGNNEILGELVKEAHNRGIKVMLDAVFNHCGFFHPYWQDVIEKGSESKYFDCFYVLDENKPIIYGEVKNGVPQEAPREELNYYTFAFTQSMPKWNTSNPIAREYLLNVACYWIEKYNIDGWRLDVSNEVSHDFWRELRKRVKAIKPDIFLLGENWDNSYPWLQGDQFDSVMNYEFLIPMWSFFRLNNSSKVKYNVEEFKFEISKLLVGYPRHLTKNLFNLLDSHDTERLLNVVDGKIDVAKLAYILLFTFPGSPCIYYGSEIGMTGGEHSNRQPMIWEKEKQNQELISLIKRLVDLRKSHESFKTENFKWVNIDTKTNTLMYKKESEEEILYVILNNDNTDVEIPLPEELKDTTCIDCIEEKDIILNKNIKVLPFEYKIYIQNK